MMETKEKEALIETSMKIILHAGEARTLMMQAFDLLEDDKFEEVDLKFKECKEQIDIAHSYQTGIVQKEANGEIVEYSPLFTHAQDILMTVQSQLVLCKRIARLYKNLEGKIGK